MNNYGFEDIIIGLEERFETTITIEMMEAFYMLTGDNNPLHLDEDYAKSKGYAGKVCYGMLTASFLSTLAGVYLPGKRSIIHNIETMFKKPVFVGDKLTIVGKVVDNNEIFKVISVRVEIFNQDMEKVVRGTMKVGFLDD